MSASAADRLFLPLKKNATSLADFGYGFPAAPHGAMQHLATGSKYVFLSQKHYDCLGDAVVNEMYTILQTFFGFARISLPLDASPSESQAPIFISPNASSCDTLLLVCQGSGAVRPGMWARQLCMNDTLDRGSIFPYLSDALQRGWGVAVLNPNENSAPLPTAAPPAASSSSSPVRSDTVGGVDEEELRNEWERVSKQEWASTVAARMSTWQAIRGSECPENHLVHVYHTVVPLLFPKHRRVFIVAHSYGGKCVSRLVRWTLRSTPDAADAFRRTVPAVALTDAINDLRRNDYKEVKDFFRKRVVNWVTSKAPLDTILPSGPEGCPEFSCGHTDHVHSSESCRSAVFRYFDGVIRNSGAPVPYQELLRAEAGDASSSAVAPPPTAVRGRTDGVDELD